MNEEVTKYLKSISWVSEKTITVDFHSKKGASLFFGWFDEGDALDEFGEFLIELEEE